MEGPVKTKSSRWLRPWYWCADGGQCPQSIVYRIHVSMVSSMEARRHLAIPQFKLY